MEIIKEKDIDTKNCSYLTEIKEQKEQDFSNKDFIKCHVDGVTYDYSFFKGCDFNATNFFNCSLKHIEFDESSFNNECRIVNCSFNSSDFIYNIFENVVFENCCFDNGEWRESTFTNVTFVNCTFQSTTINLCIFSMCTFDEESSKSFHGTSKTYNLFSFSKFNLHDVKFLTNNFGLYGKQLLEQKVNEMNIQSKFYELSTLYYHNQLTNQLFIEMILSILDSFSRQETRNFQAKVKYLSNIVIQTSKNNLSVFQMYYLSDLLYKGMMSIQNQFFLLEVMKMLTSLRTEITLKMDLIDKSTLNYHQTYITDYEAEIFFEKSFSQEYIKTFLLAVSIAANVSYDDIKLIEYSVGSTYVKLLIKSTLAISILLKSVNYLLPQVSIVLKNTNQVCIEYKELKHTITKPETNAAIIKSLDNSQYHLLKKIKDKASNNLIAFDGKAQITL